MTLGEKLQDLRKKSGLTQEDIAEKLDITRQTISKWELDQSSPDLGYLVKLADFYQVSTDYLIRDKSDMPDASRKDEPADNMFELQKMKRISAPMIALGSILSFTGGIGFLFYIIMSAVHPYNLLNINENKTYEGLKAYLLATNSSAFFILFIVFMVFGAAIFIALSIRMSMIKAKTKQNL